MAISGEWGGPSGEHAAIAEPVQAADGKMNRHPKRIWGDDLHECRSGGPVFLAGESPRMIAAAEALTVECLASDASGRCRWMPFCQVALPVRRGLDPVPTRIPEIELPITQ